MSVVAGVDVGSLMSKAAILMDDNIFYSLVPSTVSSEKSGLAAFQQALEKAGVHDRDVEFVVATGYGRISAPYADAKVTEITCHARGAYFLNPNVRTVLDIGGQDCKAIRVGEDGSVTDFVMNDKCAAGTGRFLEVLARIFEVGLDQLGDFCLKAEQKVPISSTCTVFAESEIISLMAQGEKAENVIAGVHHSLARRAGSLLHRLRVEEQIAFTGGVGKNIGMRRSLEEIICKPITPLIGDPQLVGALGAALIAKERSER